MCPSDSATQKQRNYYKYIVEHKDITKVTMMLSSAVSSTKSEVSQYLEVFAKYMFLWKDDREEKLKVDRAIDLLKKS